MKAPSEFIRITLADEIPSTPGIYILSYMGRIVYIGKAETDVKGRLETHRWEALDSSEILGEWMVKCDDWSNIGLDILVPPFDYDIRVWLQDAEAACVQKFNPLFNEQLQLEKG